MVLPTRLEVIGGLYEATAEVWSAKTKEEVLAAFSRAQSEGQKLTLAGAQRSFGEQYLPPHGGKVLDVSSLDRGAQIIEQEPDGSVWIRAGGGTTFRDLHEMFPSYRVSCPPTTDTITLAGALAACTHNSAGYFADAVRAFTLLTPRGQTLFCSEASSGLERELFEHVPGSFGALGVTTDIEIRLRPYDPNRWVMVQSVYAGPASGCLDALERTRDDPRFSEGAGAVIYGVRGHSIVLGDELLPAGDRPRVPQALLTGEDLAFQSITQSLVHRFPRLAERILTGAYPMGAGRFAPLYGFLFFQRSYDEAHRRMTRGGFDKALLQVFGARNRMPICHMSWFFPRAELRAFVEGYFSVLERYPGLEKLVEQQDIVLLGPCRWPCHSMGRTEEPIGTLTASFAVQRGATSEKRVREFMREVTTRSAEFSPGARVSLCKQIHAEGATLRRMHRGFSEAVARLRAHTDPSGLLTSRMLKVLLDT